MASDSICFDVLRNNGLESILSVLHRPCESTYSGLLSNQDIIQLYTLAYCLCKASSYSYDYSKELQAYVVIAVQERLQCGPLHTTVGLDNYLMTWHHFTHVTNTLHRVFSRLCPSLVDELHTVFFDTCYQPYRSEVASEVLAGYRSDAQGVRDKIKAFVTSTSRMDQSLVFDLIAAIAVDAHLRFTSIECNLRGQTVALSSVGYVCLVWEQEARLADAYDWKALLPPLREAFESVFVAGSPRLLAGMDQILGDLFSPHCTCIDLAIDTVTRLFSILTGDALAAVMRLLQSAVERACASLCDHDVPGLVDIYSKAKALTNAASLHTIHCTVRDRLQSGDTSLASTTAAHLTEFIFLNTRASGALDMCRGMLSLFDTQVILAAYQTTLLRRLTQGGDLCLDREVVLAGVVGQCVGEDHHAAMQGMMRDVGATHSVRCDLPRHVSPLSPVILTQAVWPCIPKARKVDCVIPQHMRELRKSVGEHYSVCSPLQRLEWVPCADEVVMRSQYSDGREYDIVVSLPQAIVLQMMSNATVSYTAADVTAACGFHSVGAATCCLESLSRPGCTLLTRLSGGVYRVNATFYSAQTRVFVSAAHHHTTNAAAAAESSTIHSCSHAQDARVMTILKTHRSISFDNTYDALSSTSTHIGDGNISRKTLKACLERLVDRDLIRRDAEIQHVFHYVP